MEIQIVEQLSWARTKPSEVAAALQERLKCYKGKDYFPPHRDGACVVTKEGKGVVEEAIRYCMSLEPMGGVGSESEIGLALAGEDHIVDVGSVGVASHDSSDGTGSADRALRYGRFQSFGECLWYGSAEADARCQVLDLVVDDGVPSRGHRLGVFNPIYNVVGVAYGPHKTFGKMSAMEFATGWSPDEQIIAQRKQSGPVTVTGTHAQAGHGTAWKLGACPMCGEQIKGGRVCEIPELGKLHAACLKCGGCDIALSGKPFKLHSKVPFCNACYAQKSGEICGKCQQPLAGSIVNCALGKFHVACLECSQCGKAIGKARFSTAGGVMACQACGGGGAGLGAAAPGSNGHGRPASRGTASSRNATAVGAAGSKSGLVSLGRAVAQPPQQVPKPKSKSAGRGRGGRSEKSMGGALQEAKALGMDYANLE